VPIKTNTDNYASEPDATERRGRQGVTAERSASPSFIFFIFFVTNYRVNPLAADNNEYPQRRKLTQCDGTMGTVECDSEGGRVLPFSFISFALLLTIVFY
jgi:hypothetical protein